MPVIRECVIISTPDGIHNNFGLQIISEDPRKVANFENMFLDTFGDDGNESRWHWFWQGGHMSESWRYFEFWKDFEAGDHEVLLASGEYFAKVLNLELDIH